MLKILVIGESCRDEFIYCEALRLAPDLPVPVLQELTRNSNPGMAANVHRNIQSREANVGLITNADWQSVTKTRYVHEMSNHLFLRVDTSHDIQRIELTSYRLDAEIVVISDYNKGFLTSEDIQMICENNKIVFLDTKKKLGSWAKSASYIKINDFEYLRSEPNLDSELSNKIIRTRGKRGCDFQGKNYPVELTEIRDTSGAGDSFLAALVVEFSRSRDIYKSIAEANLAASSVVRTRGVGII